MPSSPPNNESNSTSSESPKTQSADDIPNNNDAASGADDRAMLLVMMGATGRTRLGPVVVSSGAGGAVASTTASAVTGDRQAEPSQGHHHVTDHETAEQKNDGPRSPPVLVASQLASTGSTDAATEQIPTERLPQTSSLPPSSKATTQTQGTSSTNAIINRPLNSDHVRASVEGAVASLDTTKNQIPGKGQEFDNGALQEGKNATRSELAMSIDKLIPPKKAKTPRKRPPQVKEGQATGRWTNEEHQAFLEGLRTCGREWKKVASLIPTRTSAQIRSHAQKYFAKVQREEDSTIRDGQSSCGGASAIPSDASLSQMPPSVQQNVERIIANPGAVQREVEDTLQALRDRYHQLQQRLEQQQRQRRGIRRNRGQLVEDANRVVGAPAVDDTTRRRKRMLSEVDAETQQANRLVGGSDDHSASSSGVSASVPPRDFANGEIIALHVLGGALPRGDSSVDTVTAQELPMEGAEELQPAGDAAAADDAGIDAAEGEPHHPSSASNGSSTVTEDSCIPSRKEARNRDLND